MARPRAVTTAWWPTSAHIEGVESEVVVRSPHSVQANPEAIGEVRRILLLHLAGAIAK